MRPVTWVAREKVASGDRGIAIRLCTPANSFGSRAPMA
jgi:hypothetical protein